MNEKVLILRSDDFDANDKFVWERPMTLALIQEYKRFEPSFKDPSVKKKLIWKNIAACLHARGFKNVSDDSCDKKWRNLKKTFKDIYTGQRCKNNGKWAYYDLLEEVLGRDPKIVNALVSVSEQSLNPLDNLSAVSKHPVIHKYKTADGQNVHVEVVDIGEISHILDGQEEEESSEIKNAAEEDTEDENSPVEIICQEYNGDDNDQTVAEADQDRSPPPWFTNFLNEYRENEERRLELMQNMHEDVLAMENKKVALLEKLLDKLSKSSENPNSENVRNETIAEKDYSGL